MEPSGIGPWVGSGGSRLLAVRVERMLGYPIRWVHLDQNGLVAGTAAGVVLPPTCDNYARRDDQFELLPRLARSASSDGTKTARGT